MGKQHNNPYRKAEPHYFERTSNGRRAMRNKVRWHNKRTTGTFGGLTDAVPSPVPPLGRFAMGRRIGG